MDWCIVDIISWICFGTSLNMLTYIGMIVVISDTALYNVQHLYYDHDSDDHNDERSDDDNQDQQLDRISNHTKYKFLRKLHHVSSLMERLRQN